jgi:hypothetical protein
MALARLPATQPYYVSAIDMSYLLNNKFLQNTIGYTILIFQFTFIFFFANRRLRIAYLLVGLASYWHYTVFNIYPLAWGCSAFIHYSSLLSGGGVLANWLRQNIHLLPYFMTNYALYVTVPSLFLIIWIFLNVSTLKVRRNMPHTTPRSLQSTMKLC